MVDTNLDGNDNVPILADGNNGVYIKNDALALHARPITDNVMLFAGGIPDSANALYRYVANPYGHKKGDKILDTKDTFICYNFRPQELKPNETVTYGFEEGVYAPPLDPTTMSTVTVKYVDQAGHDLADSSTLTGKIGQSYSAKPLDIKNYQLAAKPKKAYISF